MIFLKTGLPGEGKTLNTLDDVIKRQQKEFEETGNRTQVYYCNFQYFTQKDYELGKCSYDSIGKAFNTDHPLYIQVADWIEVTKDDVTNDLWLLYQDKHPAIKQQSIVVVDECQDVYPMRAKGQVPEFLKFFEKHRHTGVDFYLVTQKIRQVDVHLRELVNQHDDYKRVMGRDIVRIKSLPRVIDGKDEESPELQTSQKPYPKKLFGLYKSAVKHTHKRKLPKKVVFGIPLVLGFVFLMIYILYSILFSDSQDADRPVQNQIEEFSQNSVMSKFDSALYVVSEIQYGQSIRADFVQFLDDDKTEFIKFSLDDLIVLGYEIHRVREFLYTVNGSIVTKLPIQSYPVDYACCDDSGSKDNKQNNNPSFDMAGGAAG